MNSERCPCSCSMAATLAGTFSSSMKRIGDNYGQLRALRESFFVGQRSINIRHGEGRILIQYLLL